MNKTNKMEISKENKKKEVQEIQGIEQNCIEQNCPDTSQAESLKKLTFVNDPGSVKSISVKDLIEKMESVKDIKIDGPENCYQREIIFLKARAYDCFGLDLPYSVTWSSNGGTVKAYENIAIFQAFDPGDYIVEATIKNSRKERRIKVMALPPIIKDLKDVPPPVEKAETAIAKENKEIVLKEATVNLAKDKSNYIPPQFNEREISYEERRRKLPGMMETKKTIRYRIATLANPVGNIDVLLGLGAYGNVYLAAQSIQEGRIRDGIVFLLITLLLILGKFGTEKGPLTKTLENLGKKVRNRYNDTENTLRGE